MASSKKRGRQKTNKSVGKKQAADAPNPPIANDDDDGGGGDREWRTFEDGNEAIEQAFKEGFPDPPSDALYRTGEVELSDGGLLMIFDETSPSDPDHFRRVYLERVGSNDSNPANPIWEQPEREPGQPEFDVAVSFAGEQRDYVRQVVTRLRDEGVRVFYDADEQAQLWGQNLLEVFDETYRSRAHRVLMFVSEAYARKNWPTAERRFALEGAMESKGPYILPVRLDDTRVPGLPATTAYVDGRAKTGVEVADLTIEHLREHGIEVPPPPAHREMAQRVSVRAIPGQTPEGIWEVPYEVHNGSDYPIESAVLVINDPGQDGKPEDQMGTALEVVVGTIPSGKTHEDRFGPIKFEREPIFGELPYLATLLFTDHWGNHWASTGTRLMHRRYPPRVC
jgi:hypothetical protein